jgi:hypothetical protein
MKLKHEFLCDFATVHQRVSTLEFLFICQTVNIFSALRDYISGRLFSLKNIPQNCSVRLKSVFPFVLCRTLTVLSTSFICKHSLRLCDQFLRTFYSDCLTFKTVSSLNISIRNSADFALYFL